MRICMTALAPVATICPANVADRSAWSAATWQATSDAVALPADRGRHRSRGGARSRRERGRGARPDRRRATREIDGTRRKRHGEPVTPAAPRCFVLVESAFTTFGRAAPYTATPIGEGGASSTDGSVRRRLRLPYLRADDESDEHALHSPIRRRPPDSPSASSRAAGARRRRRAGRRGGVRRRPPPRRPGVPSRTRASPARTRASSRPPMTRRRSAGRSSASSTRSARGTDSRRCGRTGRSTPRR